ncbi:ATP-binding protein [Streptomyces sp. NPDC018031]|uniref:ATP-binding protein n=1 Tax=Streptomyces sp. NPDC018031 TaxID=3365033 RepID=UPI0037B05ECE
MEILGSTPPDRGPAAPRVTPGYEGPGYEGVWRFTAPALDSSVPRARHTVRQLLAHRRVPVTEDLVQSLLLIVSELVTNAVRHAAVLSPEITVELSVGGGWIRVAVEDDHPYRPKALEADQSRTGGRGLLLVQAVAEEAGGTHDVSHVAGGGKAVWAVLPLAPAGGTGAAPPAGPVTAPVTSPRRPR